MINRELNYGRNLIKKFIQNTNLNNETVNIVDLGAGHGDDLKIAGKIYPKSSRWGCESYKPYVQELSNAGISVVNINIERDRLPFDNETVDIVIANQVLEHCKEIFWIFHEVSRVLKKDGIFIVGVPNLASFHNRALLLAGRQPTPIKTASAHVRGFTVGDIQGFVSDCFPGGYRMVDFGGANFYPFPEIIAKPLAKMMPTLSWGIFMSFKKIEKYSNQFQIYPTSNQLETNFWVGE